MAYFAVLRQKIMSEVIKKKKKQTNSEVEAKCALLL